MNDKNKTISIVGAGPSGSLLALYLAKLGFIVEVFEKRNLSPKNTNPSAGRSINLAISHRGLRALKKLGLDQEVLKESLPMKGREIHLKDDLVSFMPYGVNSEHYIYSLSRSRLNQFIIEKSFCNEKTKNLIHYHFQDKVLSAHPKEKTLNLESGHKHHYSYLIGADGANSIVRESLCQAGKTQEKIIPLSHSYLELSIPAGIDSSFLLKSDALHIWPRESFMLIALPNINGTFTCTLFLERKKLEKLHQNLKEGRAFFEKEFPDALKLMPNFDQDFTLNPISHLNTVYSSSWFFSSALIIGDAAHAIVPFYGQGMNACFEDCYLLIEEMEKKGITSESSDDKIQQVFKDFEGKRKKDTDAIAQMAIDNFTEMRDHTADPFFMKMKAMERSLTQKYPNKFISQYHMVSFSHCSYHQAYEQGKRQKELLKSLLADENDEGIIDEKIIAKKLNSFYDQIQT